jgi:hypothetical protein
MGKKSLIIGLFCVGWLGFSSTAQAKTIERNVSRAVETIECDGSVVTITGESNKLTFIGECTALEITGSKNEIWVENVGSIEIRGMSNEVVWSEGIGGKPPKVDDNGARNKIRQGTIAPPEDAPPPKMAAAPKAAKGDKAGEGDKDASEPVPEEDAPPPAKGGAAVVLNDNNLTAGVECQGNDVTINGNKNTLRLRGECRRVYVKGNFNRVAVEAAVAIYASGNKNDITWSRGAGKKAPSISNPGGRNKITRGDVSRVE